MKKLKLLICLLVGVLVVCPNVVDARVLTEDEANEIFANLPIRENEDNSCTFSVNTIPYDTLKENACGFTYEEYVNKHPYKDTYTESKLRDAYDLDKGYCESSFSYHVFNHYENVSINYDENTKNVDITVFYGGTEDEYGNLSNFETMNATCKVEYVTPEESKVELAQELNSELDHIYSLYGYDVINSFYHYGGLRADMWSNTAIMYRFPKIKEKLLEYPEFEYKVSSEGGAISFLANSSGFIKAFDNDVLYGMSFYSANYIGLLLVDKDEEGTTVEKAERALDAYFHGKVRVEFDPNFIFDINDSGYDPANKAFGTDGVDYEGIDVYATINGEQHSIGVVEMDKEDIKAYEVKAKHKGTGVYVETDSYEVPVDATLEVEDVTEEVKKKYKKEMYKVHSAYDINVIKMTDGGFIRQIDNGITVYLPITGHEVGEEIEVKHITDNSKDEGFKGVVVEDDDKLYVKFETTHFSTYAIVEALDTVTNPNTSDNIMIYVITFIISSILLGGCIVFRLRKN